jgi:hypothetical protein
VGEGGGSDGPWPLGYTADFHKIFLKKQSLKWCCNYSERQKTGLSIQLPKPFNFRKK